MKKLTKGAIAAAAGVTLLLSGGGTLAYWNATTNGGSAAITSGNLALAQNGTPTWTLTHTTGTAVPVPDITKVKLVPGDKLTYTGSYNVTAMGDDLVVKVSLAKGAVTGTSSGSADTALAGRLTADATYTVNGTAGATTTIKHRKATEGTYPVVVTATLTWPLGLPEGASPETTSPTSDNPAKLGSVNLSNFAITAYQVDGTLNP